MEDLQRLTEITSQKFALPVCGGWLFLWHVQSLRCQKRQRGECTPWSRVFQKLSYRDSARANHKILWPCVFMIFPWESFNNLKLCYKILRQWINAENPNLEDCLGTQINCRSQNFVQSSLTTGSRWNKCIRPERVWHHDTNWALLNNYLKLFPFFNADIIR
jgi:hypothetical protein